MENNEDCDSLKNIPTFTLPAPPRFDAAASAAARPVEPLTTRRILPGLYLKSKSSRFINRRSKFLALMAILGLGTGAAGGILVVESNKLQQPESSASMIQIPTEQTPTSDSAAPAPENNGASLEVSEHVENQVRVRRNQRQARKQARSELEVLSNTDEDEDEDLERDKDNDDEEEKDKNDDERKKDRDRERNSKGRDHDADSDRRDRSGRGAMLYDVMRTRKP